jgi:MFS family permease
MLRSGFSRLWFGETVSVLGTQVTFLALPLAAVMILGASPFQMGLLGAVDNMPYLIFGLGVGVLVDRVSRRRALVNPVGRRRRSARSSPTLRGGVRGRGVQHRL